MPFSPQASERPGRVNSRMQGYPESEGRARILVPRPGDSGKARRFRLCKPRRGTTIVRSALHLRVGGTSGQTDAGPARQESVEERKAAAERKEIQMRDVELMVKDYRLTTAEILYHMPDHPSLLQTYVWQSLDIAPKFPVLHKFLAFWETSLDGRLHSVKIASAELLKPSRYRHTRALMRLH